MAEGIDMHDIRDTLNERGKQYRHFPDNATTAQRFKDVYRMSQNFDGIDDCMAEALDVIASKIARILNGDPTYRDNWIDIMGYCQLVLDELDNEGVTSNAK